MPRIVAVGDVHGDRTGLVSILQRTGLIDERHRWIGGESILVQVGDLIDRGPQDRAVLDLVMDLQSQAKKAGGKLVVLLGNHEIMNMMGDLRYVSPESWAEFADKDSEKRRRKLLAKAARHSKRRAKQLQRGDLEPGADWEAGWLSEHPLGYAERVAAFSSRGRYGKWLRKLPVAFELGGVVFVHAGISAQLAPLSIDEVNKRVRNEIRAFDTYRKHLSDEGVLIPEFTLQELLSAVRQELTFQKAQDPRSHGLRRADPASAQAEHRQYLQLLEGILRVGGWYTYHSTGPVWFRGYANWSEDEGAEKIDAILESIQAAAIVVGHSPQLGSQGIRSRFGGRVFLIDTGLYNAYYKGGRPSALEIKNGRFTAVYLDSTLPLDPPEAR